MNVKRPRLFCDELARAGLYASKFLVGLRLASKCVNDLASDSTRIVLGYRLPFSVQHSTSITPPESY